MVAVMFLLLCLPNSPPSTNTNKHTHTHTQTVYKHTHTHTQLAVSVVEPALEVAVNMDVELSQVKLKAEPLSRTSATWHVLGEIVFHINHIMNTCVATS